MRHSLPRPHCQSRLQRLPEAERQTKRNTWKFYTDYGSLLSMGSLVDQDAVAAVIVDLECRQLQRHQGMISSIMIMTMIDTVIPVGVLRQQLLLNFST